MVRADFLQSSQDLETRESHKGGRRGQGCVPPVMCPLRTIPLFSSSSRLVGGCDGNRTWMLYRLELINVHGSSVRCGDLSPTSSDGMMWPNHVLCVSSDTHVVVWTALLRVTFTVTVPELVISWRRFGYAHQVFLMASCHVRTHFEMKTVSVVSFISDVIISHELQAKRA